MSLMVAGASAAPSSQRADLGARLQEIEAQKAALKVDAVGFKGSLKQVENEFKSVFVSIDTQARPSDELKQLQKDIDGIKKLNLADDQVLRQKPDGRIVAQPSKSFLKNLLGIGKSERKQQAQVLSVRYTGAATLKDLQQRLGRVQENQQRRDAGVVSTVIAEREPQLVAALDKALMQAVGDVYVAPEGYVENSIAALKGSAPGDIKGVMSSKVDELQGTYERVHDEKLKALDSERSGIQRQISEAKLQAVQQQRAEKLKAAGVVVPTRSAETLKIELDELTGQGKLGAVYHTNVGCEAIQRMFEASGAGIKGGAVISEIEARHGDDTFTRGAKSQGQELRSYASSLTSNQLYKIDLAHYKHALVEFRDGKGGYEGTYRQARHSSSMIKTLQSMVGKYALLKPVRWMSTAGQVKETLNYPAKPAPGLEKVHFTISGFSAASFHSDWSFNGESGERVYTTQSHFLVESVKQDRDGSWQVKLQEYPVSVGQVPPGFVVSELRR